MNIGHAGGRARLARNGMARGVAAVVAMWVALGFALGKDWDEIKETLDPTGNFLTYNIFGTNVGPGTKVRSVIKLFAESAENPFYNNCFFPLDNKRVHLPTHSSSYSPRIRFPRSG